MTARQRQRTGIAAEVAAVMQRAARRRGVGPTATRNYVDARSHMPPKSMTDNTGGPWLGTSRVIDRPARRRSERRSWRALKAQGRRDFLAQGSE